MAIDELVMAVPTAELFAPGAFQGLATEAEPWLRRIFEPRRSRFIPRSAAEEDPAWKQVIPYVLLVHGETVFCYRRGKQSTEARLVAQRSIGLGGHIRHSDETIFAAPGWPAYQAAMRRELDEEVAIPEGAVVSDRLVGMINDDSVPVGRVHVGLVHVWELREGGVKAREGKIADGRFASLGELRAMEGLETWSRFCVDGWDQLRAQPGWLPS